MSPTTTRTWNYTLSATASKLAIESYEKDGIEWEYKVEPLSGNMLVVPKGTPEWELPRYW